MPSFMAYSLRFSDNIRTRQGTRGYPTRNVGTELREIPQSVSYRVGTRRAQARGLLRSVSAGSWLRTECGVERSRRSEMIRLDSEPLELRLQGLPRHPEYCGRAVCARDSSRRLSQCVFDHRLLTGGEVRGERHGPDR